MGLGKSGEATATTLVVVKRRSDDGKSFERSKEDKQPEDIIGFKS
jgi:hypothetical protein